jgi:hypothetical protein
VLQAFLNYLEEFPATRRWADVLTQALVEHGDLKTEEA